MNIIDLNTLKSFRAKAVNVGTGDDMIQYPKGIFVGNSKWSDEELNAIGFARFEGLNTRPAAGKREVSHSDDLVSNVMVRSYVWEDYTPPVVPDATPTKVAVEGDQIVNPDVEGEFLPAVIGATIPNLDYNYMSERANVYPSQDEITIALWEAVVEGRPEAKDALEIKRQAVKVRFPKA
tara:strand:- start:594 stop:1130 length:537 start_codon:yes stop_codon:yes gene_type:complete